jgi:hypothetical protein
MNPGQIDVLNIIAIYKRIRKWIELNLCWEFTVIVADLGSGPVWMGLASSSFTDDRVPTDALNLEHLHSKFSSRRTMIMLTSSDGLLLVLRSHMLEYRDYHRLVISQMFQKQEYLLPAIMKTLEIQLNLVRRIWTEFVLTFC